MNTYTKQPKDTMPQKNTVPKTTAQTRDNIMYITQPEPIYQTPLIPEQPCEKMQILLAESDLTACESVRTALEADGFTVIVAREHCEILSVATTHSIDLILLDVGPSQLDGWGFRYK